MKNSKIKMIRLTQNAGGVDLVGEIETKENSVLITNPVEVSINMQGHQANIQMSPWNPIAGQNHQEIERTGNIVLISQVREEIIQKYKEIFGFSGSSFGLDILKKDN